MGESGHIPLVRLCAILQGASPDARCKTLRRIPIIGVYALDDDSEEVGKNGHGGRGGLLNPQPSRRFTKGPGGFRAADRTLSNPPGFANHLFSWGVSFG